MYTLKIYTTISSCSTYMTRHLGLRDGACKDIDSTTYGLTGLHHQAQGLAFHLSFIHPNHPDFPAPASPWCPRSSCSVIVFSNSPSRPVGSSGAKNRCGRSHEPSSYCADMPFFLPRVCRVFEGAIGDQSIALGSRSRSSSSTWSMSSSFTKSSGLSDVACKLSASACPFATMLAAFAKDGLPNTALGVPDRARPDRSDGPFDTCPEKTGLFDRLRDDSMSGGALSTEGVVCLDEGVERDGR